MLTLMLQVTFYRKHAYLARPNYIACQDSAKTNVQYLAFTGTTDELNKLILADPTLTTTFNKLTNNNVFNVVPASAEFQIEKVAGLALCSGTVKTNCYVLANAGNIAASKTSSCADANVFITVSSLTTAPLSNDPNMYATAEVSSGLFSGLIVLMYFLITLFPAVTVQEPIILPKGEHEQ